MTNVSDDVLRIIANNRGWTKNYAILVGLVKNPKTPLAMSMNMMQRLNDRDLSQLSARPQRPRAASRGGTEEDHGRCRDGGSET